MKTGLKKIFLASLLAIIVAICSILLTACSGDATRQEETMSQSEMEEFVRRAEIAQAFQAARNTQTEYIVYTIEATGNIVDNLIIKSGAYYFAVVDGYMSSTPYTAIGAIGSTVETDATTAFDGEKALTPADGEFAETITIVEF